MIETAISEIAATVIPIAIGAVGVVYGIVKRIKLKEAVSIIETLQEVTNPLSEGGKAITVDEKLMIADEVIEILKK